jgi:hypothetical protein
MHVVTDQVHRAGYDSASAPNYTPVQPSVYLPTAFPLLALFTWMPWEPARLLWACLAAGLFAWSLRLFVPELPDVESGTRWLVLAGAFCFTPVALGLSHGNPSVLACSLTMLAVFWATNGRTAAAALALGIVHCIKPQISIIAVLLFALWRYWRPLLLSFICPVVIGIISLLRAPSLAAYWQWLMSLRQALAVASTPGSINDPSPANEWGAYSMVNAQTVFSIWVRNPLVVNMLVWITAIGLAAAYLTFRSRFKSDKRPRDMAFFSALSLLVVYHRFYDEQILLIAIPFLLLSRGTRNIALWVCMAALMLPLHVGADLLRTSFRPDTILGLFLLRPLSLIVLSMCVLLIPWTAAAVREEPVPRPESAQTKVAGR